MRFPLLTIPFYVAVLAAPCTPVLSTPLITEFLASNSTGLTDEDGAHADWIEIYNPDATAVDLGGFILTDDPGALEWTFPAGAVIQPGGYLVVFASGKDRALAGSPLHTNFRLSAGGEYLALTGPGGTPILSQFSAYPGQSADVSYGVVSQNAGAAPAFFNTPTPGAANNTVTAQAEAVQFLPASRTFPSGTALSITLAVSSPTATIRYTANRSVPTAASTLYTGGSIPVTVNTRIRARAFEPGRPDGPVVSETYFALDAAALAFTSNLPIVITDSWNTSPGEDATVPAHLMVFEPKPPDNLARMTNSPDLSTPCSLERRGSSTAGDPKYSMAVELWDESNNDRHVKVMGMPSDSDWIMHAPYYYDRSLMHNDLIYRLSNEAGRYAVRTKFVEHFHNTTKTPGAIGGALTGSVDYFGVYSFMEKITRGDDRVDVEKLTTLDNTAPAVQGGYIIKADRRDPGDSGLEPLPGQSFGPVNHLAWVYPKEQSPDPARAVTTAQSNYLRQYLGAMWAKLEKDDDEDFVDPVRGYAQYIDVPAAIDHHLFNVAPKNVDAFRLSAFWSKSRFGKLTAGPLWDFDRSQGSTDGRDRNPLTWNGDTGEFGTDFFHYAWYNEMFNDPNFWQAWIDRLDQLRHGVLSTAHVHAVIDEFSAQLNPDDAAGTPAKRNAARWLGPRGASSSTPGTDGTYAGEVQWLKNWWGSRLSFMDGRFTRPATASLPGGPVPAGSTITLTSPSLSTPGVKLYYTTTGIEPRPRSTVSEIPADGLIPLAVLLPEIGPVRAIVPSSATTGGATGTEWRGADLNGNGNNHDDFDDSAWFANAAGTSNGVGYDDTIASGEVSFLPYVGLRWNTLANTVVPQNASNTMRASATLPGNPGCYVRLPFTLSAAQVAMLAAPNKLYLQVRFDDGFIAWLNGQEVAKFNQPATWPSVTWSSPAGNSHSDSDAIQYVDFDLTVFVNRAHAGNNLLALQGLNSSVTSADFLCQARLVIKGPPPPLSPGTVEYTGPITLNAPTQLFIRAWHPAEPSDPPFIGSGGPVPNGSRWSAPTVLYYFPGAAAAAQANIRITEVLYHPASPAPDEAALGFENSNDFEFIRLTNISSGPVDLTGMYFSNGLEFTAVPGLQNWLPAGQSVVVVENRDAFLFRYGAAFTILGEFSGELDNGGEHIVLNDGTGSVMADFIYDDKAPWPVAADRGHSLRYLGGDQKLAASWSASLDPGGTAVDTFARWQRRYFASDTIPLQPMTKDTDGDGLNNLREYAFGSDPRVPIITENINGYAVPGNPLGFTIKRRAGTTDISYSFETASILGNWTPSGRAPETIVNNIDGTETVTWRAAADPGPRLFMRVRVTSP